MSVKEIPILVCTPVNLDSVDDKWEATKPSAHDKADCEIFKWGKCFRDTEWPSWCTSTASKCPKSKSIAVWCQDAPEAHRDAEKGWRAGCSMCFNFTNSGLTDRSSKWARWDVEPESIEQIKLHGKSKLHVLSVAHHFQCEVKEVQVEKHRDDQ